MPQTLLLLLAVATWTGIEGEQGLLCTLDNCNISVSAQFTNRTFDKITQPDFPDGHPDTNCTWTVRAESTQRIKLVINSLDLSSPKDRLIIYDGPFITSPVIGDYGPCAKGSVTLYSTTNSALVRLVSHSNAKQGKLNVLFKALPEDWITCQSDPLLESPDYCMFGKYITSTSSAEGYITSLNLPSRTSSSYCIWSLSAPVGYRLQLIFRWMGIKKDGYRDTSSGRKCGIYNYITISDLASGSRNEYCGCDKLPVILSSDRSLWIRFRLHRSKWPGFLLTYRTIALQDCPKNRSQCLVNYTPQGFDRRGRICTDVDLPPTTLPPTTTPPTTTPPTTTPPTTTPPTTTPPTTTPPTTTPPTTTPQTTTPPTTTPPTTTPPTTTPPATPEVTTTQFTTEYSTTTQAVREEKPGGIVDIRNITTTEGMGARKSSTDSVKIHDSVNGKDGNEAAAVQKTEGREEGSNNNNMKPKGIQVACNKDHIEVTINMELFEGLVTKTLRLNDQACKPRFNNETHVIFRVPLDGCGTAHNSTKEEIIYYNAITGESEESENPLITRKYYARFGFECSYAKRRRISVISFSPRKKVVYTSEGGRGNFTYLMDLYKTDIYKDHYDTYPVAMSLGQQMYVQVVVKADSSLVVFLNTCTATPSSSYDDIMRYDFLQNGCTRDKSLLYNYKLSPVQQFSLAAFRFLNVSDQSTSIYLHCLVHVCPRSDSGSICARGCTEGMSNSSSGGRKRRATSEHKQGDPLGILTLGPIYMKDKQTDHGGSTVDDQVFAVGVLVGVLGFVAVSLTAIVVVVLVRRKRLNTCPPTSYAVFLSVKQSGT